MGMRSFASDRRDGGVTPDLDALEAAIDGSTALVTLSHVAFKSGYLYDMQSITGGRTRQAPSCSGT